MMRIPLLLALLLASVLAHGSDGWTIAVDSPGDTIHNPAIGNGQIGGKVKPTATGVERLFSATAWSEPQGDRVSSIIPVISPVDASITIDGTPLSAVNIKQKRLDMLSGEYNTVLGSEKAEVTCRLMALRSLPAAIMLVIDVKALKDVDCRIVNTPSVPSGSLTIKDRTLWVDGHKFLLQQATMPYKSGHDLMASSSLLLTESNVAQSSAGFIELKLKAGESASIAVIGVSLNTSDFTDPVNETERQVVYAAHQGVQWLVDEHRSRWASLWQGDIEIDGNDQLQLQARSALYNIYSAALPGSRRSIPPMGLTSDKYSGHIFWDADTWILPAMAVLQPQIARDMVDYRIDRLPQARRKAMAYGYRGAMFPWESDNRGEESTPTFALTGPLEHHVTADVARGAWLYFCAAADTAWLAGEGYPLLRECADFWVGRAVPNPDSTYSIKGVVGADEYTGSVDDNAFTNAAARRALEYAAKAAEVLGVKPDSRWLHVADNLRLVESPEDSDIILEYEGYAGQKIKQADVAMLAYPLGVMSDSAMIDKNLKYYESRLDSIDGPAMSHSAMAVNYLRMNQHQKASALIEKATSPYMRGDFMTFAETPANNETYFLTGAGGLLQALVFGYGGYDITDHGVVQNKPPLPIVVKIKRNSQ